MIKFQIILTQEKGTSKYGIYAKKYTTDVGYPDTTKQIDYAKINIIIIKYRKECVEQRHTKK